MSLLQKRAHILPLPGLSLARALRDKWQIKTRPRISTHKRVLPFILACNEFGGYCILRDSVARPACQAVLRGEVWERETLQFMTRNCDAGDVVHAGTFFGDFLPALSLSLAPGAIIWAFEPNRQSFRCASMTLLANGLENIRLHNAALGAKTGSVSYVSRDEYGRSLGGSGYVGEQGGAHAETVAQIPLDEAVPPDRRVSILQLDIESYEDQALRGASALLARDRPILILETVPMTTWFSEQISALGYRVTGQLDGNSIFVADRSRSSPL